MTIKDPVPSIFILYNTELLIMLTLPDYIHIDSSQLDKYMCGDSLAAGDHRYSRGCCIHTVYEDLGPR